MMQTWTTPMGIMKPVGTFDDARPVDQMRAIDLALRHYYQEWDWLRARQQRRKLTR